jgi:hypothetical protein
MAEFVTVARIGGPNPDGRRLLAALAERLGDGSTVRASNARDAQAALETLQAAAARFGIVSVAQHVCRHDEGVGICS